MSSLPTAPVLFLVFNRPETTQRTLEAIRRAAPSRLFIAADGPRVGNMRDADRCAEVLSLVQRTIDWSCAVEYLKRPTNLGCRMAVSSAITWFFDRVDEGIILEDDCLPADQFFPFCSALLNRYRDEQRVAHIGGFNCQLGHRRGTASYYFSRYFHVWGWASWKRAWTGYDVEMRDYPAFISEKVLENLFDRNAIREYWLEIFTETASGLVDTWDYQWVYRNFKEDRLAIIPNCNMVENIGYGIDATHTSAASRQVFGAAQGIPTEIIHPQTIVPCRSADDFTYRKQLKLGALHDLKRLIKRVLRISARSPQPPGRLN